MMVICLLAYSKELIDGFLRHRINSATLFISLVLWVVGYMNIFLKDIPRIRYSRITMFVFVFYLYYLVMSSSFYSILLVIRTKTRIAILALTSKKKILAEFISFVCQLVFRCLRKELCYLI